jgi:hypothetical protein
MAADMDYNTKLAELDAEENARQRDRARRAIASASLDHEDAVELLAMVGLIVRTDDIPVERNISGRAKNGRRPSTDNGS